MSSYTVNNVYISYTFGCSGQMLQKGTRDRVAQWVS